MSHRGKTPALSKMMLLLFGKARAGARAAGAGAASKFLPGAGAASKLCGSATLH
jgi:hypothetical protein